MTGRETTVGNQINDECLMFYFLSPYLSKVFPRRLDLESMLKQTTGSLEDN